MNKNSLSNQSPFFALASIAALATTFAMASGCAVSMDELDASEEEQTSEVSLAVQSLDFVDEEKIANLVSGSSKYEASGVQLRNGFLHVVFDDSSRIAKINTSLTSGTLSSGSTSKSEYEGITWDDVGTQHFYVIKEMENNQGKVYKYDTSLNLLGSESTDVSFTVTNKGFEGVAYVRKGTDDYLLGLCEGKNCAYDATGPGKIKIMLQTSSGWQTQTTLSIPSSIPFSDYSDIALRSNGDGTYKIAIVSQESSRLWIGTLGTNPWSLSGTTATYEFPLTPSGDKQYCNIEGVTFLSSNQIAVVSDQYSDQNDPNQISPCFDKDESIHIFNIP